jgi:hypothetical protein
MTGYVLALSFINQRELFNIKRQEVYILCLRPEDAFVITCVANLMEVKALYVQQDLRYEISSYWRCNV